MITIFFPQHLAIKCDYEQQTSAIGDVLKVYSGNHGRAIVFCETKKYADELDVSTCIKQETHVIHEDIPEEKREMVLKVSTNPYRMFRSETTKNPICRNYALHYDS